MLTTAGAVNGVRVVHRDNAVETAVEPDGVDLSKHVIQIARCLVKRGGQLRQFSGYFADIVGELNRSTTCATSSARHLSRYAPRSHHAASHIKTNEADQTMSHLAGGETGIYPDRREGAGRGLAVVPVARPPSLQCRGIVLVLVETRADGGRELLVDQRLAVEE